MNAFALPLLSIEYAMAGLGFMRAANGCWRWRLRVDADAILRAESGAGGVFAHTFLTPTYLRISTSTDTKGAELEDSRLAGPLIARRTGQEVASQAGAEPPKPEAETNPQPSHRTVGAGLFAS